jgi:hypothetical protein
MSASAAAPPPGTVVVMHALALKVARSPRPLRVDQHRSLACHPDAVVRAVWSNRVDQPAPLARAGAIRDGELQVRTALLASPAVEQGYAYQYRWSQGWASMMAWALRPDADDDAAAAAVASLPVRHAGRLSAALDLSYMRGIGPGDRVNVTSVLIDRWRVSAWWDRFDTPSDESCPVAVGSDRNWGAWHVAGAWARDYVLETLVELYGTDTGVLLERLLATSVLPPVRTGRAVQRLCPHPALADILDRVGSIDPSRWSEDDFYEPF